MNERYLLFEGCFVQSGLRIVAVNLRLKQVLMKMRQSSVLKLLHSNVFSKLTSGNLKTTFYFSRSHSTLITNLFPLMLTPFSFKKQRRHKLGMSWLYPTSSRRLASMTPRKKWHFDCKSPADRQT